ncbi:hypothetical protein ABZ621_36515 [Streptomyces sp. NPDC007863]|uniref:hypothetical protein n=1 Tax=Streptomyces sp. NPDC007863 TaxID=3154894 RepID=UPI003400BDF5
MTRKKTTVPEYVGLLVRISFDGFRAGELYTVERDALVDGWLTLGLVELVHSVETELEVTFDGEAEAGQGSAEPDVLGDEPA